MPRNVRCMAVALLACWARASSGQLMVPPRRHCSGTKGSWCTGFAAQQPVPWKPAPRGSRECPGGCNNVGRCNYDTGLCDCPAGWTGEGCRTPFKRPCTAETRRPGVQLATPMSHIGPDGRDVDWTDHADGNPYSRCGGVCDDDTAICYCDGPMGRIPPPPGSPPGTPPLQRGRPLVTMHAAAKTTHDGRKAFGEVPYDQVYGPAGYCNVTRPPWQPGCGMDGFGGFACDTIFENFCPGACSGHGTCYLGWCKCDDGYYGHDCARRRAGLPLLPSAIPATPHLASVVGDEPPAAKEPPPGPTRKRPLVYVYDLEPLFQAKLLQYRVSPRWCVHRNHVDYNRTDWTDIWVYAADTLLHESFLLSPHRTFDPEEADFFYVPHYASCLPFPIGSWADAPWFPEPGGPRVKQMVNMLRDTVTWMNATFPFWQRRQGRDHIFLFTHDEGACWAPNVLTNSIWLTHWGRLDLNHTSNTAYAPDRWDSDFASALQPEGFLVHAKGHPCYDPKKDLVIPAFKRPGHYAASPLSGAPARKRDILFFFRGDVGKHRNPNYSRGVRQQIYHMAKANGWAAKHRFLIGDGADVEGEYSDMLSRATFCLVAPGDGWSARMEDAVLHGCIPVIIADDVHAVWDGVLDVDSFSLRLPQKEVPRILEALLALPERLVRAKQARLARVWHRYRYASLPGLAAELRAAQKQHEAAPPPPPAGGMAVLDPSPPLPRAFRGDPAQDDAFATIIQWLHSRIDDTR